MAASTSPPTTVADGPLELDPLLREVLDAVPNALLILDPAGTVLHANEALVRMLRVEPDDVVGRPLEEVAIDAPAHVAEVVRRWAGSGTPRPAAITVEGPNGEAVVLRCSGARVEDDHLVVNVEPRSEAVDDFTSLSQRIETHNLREMRVRLQRSLADVQRTNELLERSNEELERYASAVSHDLRGPLATIQGFVDLLMEDHADDIGEDGRQALEAIRRATSQMREVTSALLSLARAQPGAPDLGVADPREAVASACEQIAAELAEAEAEVVTSELPAVRADPTHLVQLFQNLIGNSVKYRHPDRTPCIEVRGRRCGGDVRITVADNGVGIPPEEREDIFAPLRRGRASGETEGTGIGLATCRRIVDLHGGSIEVVASDEPGATIAVTLPAALTSDGSG